MKQFNKRTLIGVVVLSYNESGVPLTGAFQPAKLTVDTHEFEKLLLVPAKTLDSVVTHAQAVLSDWLLKVEHLETADRETSRVETEVLSCDKWPNGTPKTCELAFYFVTTEPVTRNLTGVR